MCACVKVSSPIIYAHLTFLQVSKRKKVELLAELRSRGYSIIQPEKKNASADQAAEGAGEDDDDTESGDGNIGRGYDYLLSMPLWSLTLEKVRNVELVVAFQRVCF